jgi:hypothetical protein
MTSMVLMDSTLLESLTPSVNRPLVEELQTEEPRWFNQELKTQLQTTNKRRMAQKYHFDIQVMVDTRGEIRTHFHLKQSKQVPKETHSQP